MKLNSYLNIFFPLFITAMCVHFFYMSGFVSTLDTSYGPEIHFPNLLLSSSTIIGAFLIYFLQTFFNTMVAQKIYLFLLFFFLSYLPLRFFPFQVEEKWKYLAAVLFVVNPFVLERFLAGQWGVLWGLAMLYPFIYCLVKFLETNSVKNLQKTLLALFFIGAFSMHIFVMSVLVLVFSFLFLPLSFFQNNKKEIGQTGIAYLLLNLYWLAPIFQNGGAVVENINATDLSAFVTNLAHWNTWPFFSIFTLYGFWGEHEAWVRQFEFLPFNNLFFILPVWVVSFVIILKTKSIGKRIKIFLGFVFVFASVFSVGVSDTIFKKLNLFLFTHVSFWDGFRDSQKWSVYLVLLFSIFYALGGQYFLERIKNNYAKNTFVVLLFAIVLLYTPEVLMGFSQNLKPFDYPEGWYIVSKILSEDKDCRAVFLPSTMYYYLTPNNNLLTGNPAKVFFSCQMYTSLSPGYKGVNDIYEADESKKRVSKILKKVLPAKEKIELLKKEGIEYLVVTPDALQDVLNRDLQKDTDLQPVYVDNFIRLYRIH